LDKIQELELLNVDLDNQLFMDSLKTLKNLKKISITCPKQLTLKAVEELISSRVCIQKLVVRSVNVSVLVEIICRKMNLKCLQTVQLFYDSMKLKDVDDPSQVPLEEFILGQSSEFIGANIANYLFKVNAILHFINKYRIVRTLNELMD